MYRDPPKRNFLVEAIDLTRTDYTVGLIPDTFPDDISVDAAHAVVSYVNFRRSEYEKRNRTYDLKAVVEETIPIFQFDPGRERAYVLVVMRFYSILSQLAAYQRRKKRLPAKSKSRAKKAA